MRATIIYQGIILTKAYRASVSMMAKWGYCGLSTASDEFLIFTTQKYFHVYVIVIQSF